MHTKKEVLLTVFLLTVFIPLSGRTTGSGPSVAATQAIFAKGQPFEQDLIITAYYSPEPDQCCYVKGNYEEDMILNGEGHHGADGTAVYPGMVAAPPSYPFGTRLVIPGIGTVTVHDRGGAIQEWSNAHRIDVWAGRGEEGLARALAFGVRHVHAIVYPPQAEKPAESVDLAALPAPSERLEPYRSAATTLLDVTAKLGQKTASVSLLQERLKAIGYFNDRVTGLFGPVTQKALHNFNKDMQLETSADQLTASGAARLEAAYKRLDAKTPLPAIVNADSSQSHIAEAQRTLRFLGYYNGRTNGEYDATLKAAVLAFQKKEGIIASDTTAGAGKIGPKTRQRIIALWRLKHADIGGERLLDAKKIDDLLAKKGLIISGYFGKGATGDSVRALQKFLATKSYLKNEDVTGTFGERTEKALIAYQKESGIIASVTDKGAGYLGPASLARYRQDVKSTLMKVVREKGWEAI